jgi:hypothetical protein
VLGLLVENPVAERPKNELLRLWQMLQQEWNSLLKKPLRRLAQEMDLSYGTCHKILKQDLNLHPYKITVVQELLPRDFPAGIRYCQWFLNHLNNNNTLDLTIFSDES